MTRIAVLLSCGRHPASGRTRRANLDARALELALDFAARTQGAEIRGIHAGDPANAALRDYLGMGLETVELLDMAQGGDPVPALTGFLRHLRCDFVLCGMRAETGEGSGMVPYLVAEALGYAIIANAAAIERTAEGVRVVQALPRGRRREVSVSLPAVVAVNHAAPAARAPAFARGRQGRIVLHPADTCVDAHLATCEIRPWRARPIRMAMSSASSAAQRMKALTEAKAGEGRLIVNPGADEAARAIFDYLVEKRFLRMADSDDSRG